MDRVVHWDYFSGGKILSNWTIQHRDKEKWADYIIWILKGGGTFDINGKAKTFWGLNIQKTNVLIPIFGNSKIIQLAQEVARKNRRKMDIDGSKERNPWEKVDTLSKIRKRIQKYQNQMTEDIKKLNVKEYKKLLLLANKYGWSLNELQTKYLQATIKASTWIHLYCN